MMDPKISPSSGFMNIGNKASNLISFLSIILWCIFCSFVITFHDLYSCFYPIIKLLSFILFNSFKNPKANDPIPKQEPCPIREFGIEIPIITKEDIEIVMKSLGIFAENRPNEELEEIVSLFENQEPCLDEVKEAFLLFDQNNDGFIDAKELQKVMKSIGIIGFSKQECQRMIMAFDVNGDGKIDFGEFVRLMEECSF